MGQRVRTFILWCNRVMLGSIFRVSFFLVGMLMLPALFIALYTSNHMLMQFAQLQRDKGVRLVHAVAMQQGMITENSQTLLRTLEQLYAMQTLEPEDISLLLHETLQSSPVYTNIFLMSADGELVSSAIAVSSAVAGAGDSVAWASFMQTLAPDTLAIHMGAVESVSSVPQIYFCFPVMEKLGGGVAKPVGVIMAAVDFSFYETLFASMDIPTGAEIYLVDRQKQDFFDISPQHNVMERRLAPFFLDRVVANANTHRVGQSVFTAETAQGQAEEYVLMHHNVFLREGKQDVESYWTIALLLPKIVVQAEAQAIYWQNAKILLFTGMSAFFLVWLLGEKFFKRPVQRLLDSSQKLEKGDFAVRVAQEGGQGELEALARAFDAMAASLGERELSLRAANLEAAVVSKAKSSFLASASHELRTPMNAIIGMAYLTLQSELPAKQASYVQQIHSSGLSLLAAINDILDFSKIDAGKLQLEKTAFTLDAILENVIARIGPAAAKKGLEFLVSAAETVPNSLIGDPLRLEQILVNLTDNAVKFTDKGEVVLRCSVAELASPTIRLAFSIGDTGMGMSEEQVSMVFEPFKQMDSSVTRRFGGTGLGVPIVKRLAMLMDGDVQFTSTLGVGTTVTGTVCLELGQGAVPVVALENLRVLILDANESACIVLQGMLLQLGIRANILHDMAACAHALRSAIAELDPYTLLLIDSKMLGQGRVKGIKDIQSDINLAVQPAVLVLTPYGEHETHLPEANIIRIDAVLYKTAPPLLLFATIKRALVVQALGQAALHTAKEQGQTQLGVEQAEPLSFAGLKALVVEDNLVNQELLQNLLADFGLSVTVAHSGEEALSTLMQEQDAAGRLAFAIIFMDIEMPGMDGFAASQQIRQLYPHRHPPIVFMTAHSRDVIAHVLEESSKMDYLAKPVSVASLRSVLLRCLRTSTGEGV